MFTKNFDINKYTTHIIYLTHKLKLIFKAYKRDNKMLFIISFLYIKIQNKYYLKTDKNIFYSFFLDM